jgi:hypothetical protein
MRKAPDMWRRWNERMGYGLHRLQLQIACRGVELCKPGGRLVYSTCSLNPIENEAVVCALLRRYTGALRLCEPLEQIPSLKRARTLETWRVRAECGTWYDGWDALPEAQRAAGKLKESFFPPTDAERAAFGLARCLRVLPHNQNTGGFFVALFEKTREVDNVGAGGSGAERPPAKAPKAKAAVGAAAAAEPPVSEPSAKQRKLDDGADAAEAAPTVPPVATVATVPFAAPVDPAAPRTKLHASSDNVSSVLHGREGKAACERMFALRPELVESLAEFYGIDSARLPLDQLISRSTVAKTIFLISVRTGASERASEGGSTSRAQRCSRTGREHDADPCVRRLGHHLIRASTRGPIRACACPPPACPQDKVLEILRQDASTKLAVMNTGIRLLEWTGLRDQECQYRLCQEGLLTLVQNGHITKQVVRAPVSDLLHLYQKRSGVRADELTPETYRQLLSLRTGCFALVSEIDDAEMSEPQPAGAAAAAGPQRKHTFVCAAMWSRKQSIDVLVPKVEANSFIVWVADVPGVAPTRREQSQAGIAQAAAAAAQ